MVGGCSLFDDDTNACPPEGPTLPVLDASVIEAPVKPLLEDDGFASFRVALADGNWVNIAISQHSSDHSEAATHTHDGAPGNLEVTRGETTLDVLVEETELPEGELASYIWNDGDITVFAAALNSPIDATSLVSAVSLTADEQGWLASETTSDLSALEPCQFSE